MNPFPTSHIRLYSHGCAARVVTGGEAGGVSGTERTVHDGYQFSGDISDAKFLTVAEVAAHDAGLQDDGLPARPRRRAARRPGRSVVPRARVRRGRVPPQELLQRRLIKPSRPRGRPGCTRPGRSGCLGGGSILDGRAPAARLTWSSGTVRDRRTRT